MSSIEFSPLREGLSFGCRIGGVTLQVLEDAEACARIRQAFEREGMIVFEEIEQTSRMQAELSKVFGPLKDHPVKAVDRIEDDGMAGALAVTANPETCDIVEIDGKPYSSWLPWHFDHCYNNTLNRAGVLRLVQATPNGGHTCFADGVAIYRAMSPTLRARAEQLSVIYSLDMQPDHIKFGRPENFRVLQVDPYQFAILEQAKDYPRAIHPAVWTRETGEKVMHLSPWMAEGIEGREDAEGDALLEEIAREVNRLAEAGRYEHRWKSTDMLIWDNWRMLHRVVGCTPPHVRTIHRTTIVGDYGLGRFENDDRGRYKKLERTV